MYPELWTGQEVVVPYGLWRVQMGPMAGRLVLCLRPAGWSISG